VIIFDRFKGVQPNVLDRGLHFHIPFLQTPIWFDIDPKEYPVTITINQPSLSNKVEFRCVVVYRPRADRLTKIYLYFGPDYAKLIVPAVVHEVIKETVVCYTFKFINRKIMGPGLIRLLTKNRDLARI
jgi:regulator of protease activity HflC (stomatin/prohibitin superfamily)